MSLFEKRYIIYDWKHKKHFLTAEQLYKKVMEDSSKPDYNWITSAAELVRVCKQPGFPSSYANSIKIAILNCFTHLAKKENPFPQLPTDADAVNYCYNSLPAATCSDERRNYLAAIIHSVTENYVFEFPVYRDNLFMSFCNGWESLKFQEYSPYTEINFRELINYLKDDFDKTVKIAEEEGVFKNLDEERERRRREFVSSILSSNNDSYH